MRIGYACSSKTDGSQVLDLQRDALIAAGVKPSSLYEDRASGKNDGPSCPRRLRPDIEFNWKKDRPPAS